jgi:hypothetical protein
MSTNPRNSLQSWIALSQALREASREKDFATLGRLLGDNLDSRLVDNLIYIRVDFATVTLVGAHSDYWSTATSVMALSREPSLEEMAQVLQSAARRTP